MQELQFLRTNKSEECILENLNNKDPLICSTCLEIVGDWKLKRALEQVYQLAMSKKIFIRSEAIITLGLFSRKEDKDFLLKKLKKEKNESVKNSIYLALICIGEDKYYPHFLSGFFNKDYHIRCSTANLVDYLLSNENKEEIRKIVLFAFQNENLRSVKATLHDLLERIDRNFLKKGDSLK